MRMVLLKMQSVRSRRKEMIMVEKEEGKVEKSQRPRQTRQCTCVVNWQSALNREKYGINCQDT